MTHLTDDVVALAERLAVPLQRQDATLDLLRLVDGLRRRGHVFVLKWDGERDTASGDNGAFTAILSGGALDGEFFRRDGVTLQGAVEGVLEAYERWLRQQEAVAARDG